VVVVVDVVVVAAAAVESVEVIVASTPACVVGAESPDTRFSASVVEVSWSSTGADPAVGSAPGGAAETAAGASSAAGGGATVGSATEISLGGTTSASLLGGTASKVDSALPVVALLGTTSGRRFTGIVALAATFLLLAGAFAALQRLRPQHRMILLRVLETLLPSMQIKVNFRFLKKQK